MEGPRSKPKIFEYANYREYLRCYYEYMKGESAASFSFRRFSREAGFSSPSVLKLVIDGKRNLSEESVQRFARAIGLNQSETEFFRNLVMLNQASDMEDKRFYAQQLLKSRNYRKLNPLKSVQFDYFSKWFYVAVRELVATEDFREDPEWIAQALNPPITRAEAADALEVLQKLGVITRNEQGQLEQTNRALGSGDDVDSTSLVGFHRQMIEKGSEALERFKGDEREVSSLSFGADEETAAQIKELVKRFKKELSAIVLNTTSASAVYQLNLQFFPISQKKSKRSEEAA
jgi:uncharacterized protein (TIGR02147 family)